MSDTVIIPFRYRGPPHSGNGGWTSGHLAQLLDGGAVTVRLRTPPPLDEELSVSYADDGTVELYDGETLVAQAFAAEPLDRGSVPRPASFDEAAAAGAAYEGLVDHPFPTCFACGLREDGLALRTGLLSGREPVRAAAWVPSEVTPEVVWAALDCPGAWACGVAGRALVLGTITAELRELPSVAEQHVVMAWPTGQEGRKHFSGTALFDAEGRLLAQAEAIWLAVDAGSVRPV
ncbi:MAG TPA: hypothetical protein VFJ97_03870 [Dermatophilaceae bacterium]|nr:hypothetical protein [Dermatophilaceae bacterium]